MIDPELIATLRSRVASKLAELGMEELQQQQAPQVPGPPTGQPQPPVDPESGQPVAIDPQTGKPTTPPMMDPAAAQQADPAAAQPQPEAPPSLEEMLQSGDPIVKLLVDMSHLAEQQASQLAVILPQVTQMNKRMEFLQKAMGQFMDHQGMTQPSSTLVDLNDKMAIEAGNAQAAEQIAKASDKKSSFTDAIPNPLVDGLDPDDEDDDDSFAPASGMLPSAVGMLPSAAGPPPMPPSTAAGSGSGWLKLSSAADSYLQIGQPGTPSGSAGLYATNSRVGEINKALQTRRQG